MSKELQPVNNGELAIITDDRAAIKAFREQLENFTTLLNKAPVKEKIQKHQGYEYLPISVVEKDLDRLYFGLVQYECISYNQIFNEIACHARIKVFHPVIRQWISYDGLGSAVIQQDANTKVIDFHQHKKPNALQLTLPKAYAEAIKNAAKKIGKRFGADVNRKFEDEYEPIVTNKKPKTSQDEIQENRVREMLGDIDTIEVLMKVKKQIPEHLQYIFTERFAEIGKNTND